MKAIGCHSADNHSKVETFTFTVAEDNWTAPTYNSSSGKFDPGTFPNANASQKGFCVSCVLKSLGKDPPLAICPDFSGKEPFVCGYAQEPGREALFGGTYNSGTTSGALGKLSGNAAQVCNVVSCMGGVNSYGKGPSNVHSASLKVEIPGS